MDHARDSVDRSSPPVGSERFLRPLLRHDGIVRLGGAHNALGARLVADAGFDAVWSSGFEISASYALPDASLVSSSEFLAAARSMVPAIGIPVVADCDSGYGNTDNVAHMVRLFEQSGIGGVCIEDKTFPKRNSFGGGSQELVSIREFVEKIQAAKRAQRHSEFGVIARVEALVAGRSLVEARRRAEAYMEAGADAILVHDSGPSMARILEFAREWKAAAPLVVVPTAFPQVHIEELAEAGVKVVIYANQGLRAAVTAMREALRTIIRTGSSLAIETHIATVADIFTLQGWHNAASSVGAHLRGESTTFAPPAVSNRSGGDRKPGDGYDGAGNAVALEEPARGVAPTFANSRRARAQRRE